MRELVDLGCNGTGLLNRAAVDEFADHDQDFVAAPSSMDCLHRAPLETRGKIPLRVEMSLLDGLSVSSDGLLGVLGDQFPFVVGNA